MRLGHSLHRGIVDNKIIDLDSRVQLTHIFHGLTEQTISQFHDIGLVDGGDQLTVVLLGKVKCKLGDSLGFEPGHDLHRLNHTRVRLVFQSRIFTFSVFSDEGKVNALQTRLDAGNVFDQDQRSKNIQFFSQRNIQRFAGRSSWSKQDTFQSHLVSLQRFHSLGNPGTLVQTRNINSFPFDGDVFRLENGLDGIGDFLTNTISWNEGDGVLAPVLLGQHRFRRCKRSQATN
ncbi:hypothetical protein PGUG_03147 [Meyerozyma guilliermondii ATCC 6260]|uniref:Uncharacterized protein n=1 Tax=Meyerozyma guilliermondii (strain ATCC 6260 / CBS 566 / DSM 6381 / JCM 1539 / NBRC 10279 / NRRL Y-324) TaxID=294746 RepID=A5DIP6_PICGU|nr:uncharacterized protein PGUG_03147 [Meyerozyma guilliermondii ATCC 6260]EDK39048.1 hypothetical protein PGUG_03147 [Meyerozyma guilliermondii ATCC 6260]